MKKTAARDGGLRPLFFKKLPEFHWVAMETGLVTQGVPDANYCRDGKEGWVEFKATRSNAIGLRPTQVGWLLRRARAGGIVWIAVRDLRTDELVMIPGECAREAKERGLENLRANYLTRTFRGAPARWNWERIGELLTL